MSVSKEELETIQHTPTESYRTALDLESLRRSFWDNLYFVHGTSPRIASDHDYYMALAYTVRDRMAQRWFNTLETYVNEDAKVVSYLSAEFLMGPHLANNMINLGIYEDVKRATADRALSLDTLIAQEEEPGLGNGGLGRLAACYLDSLASLEIPAIGYGIRYEFGIFDQEIRDGWQIEQTDKWLMRGNPWELPKPERSCDVKLGGKTETFMDNEGNYRVRWTPERVVKGIPYDTPILGYRVNTCNTLRLWKAEAVESFDFDAFNVGNYYGAVDEKVLSENLTKILYPNDEPVAGKRLRLEQQYFFVSCSLQDMIRVQLLLNRPLEQFHEKWAVQLNDTHPAIGVAELMRLLVDEHAMAWDKAWDVTTKAFAYTNHTLLPEALEKWPLELFKSVLPRHLEIIYEINSRFLDDIRIRFPGDNERLSRMSIIDESGGKYVRMANLATVGSHAVNGVAALHTDLLKQSVMRDFNELWPEKFSNKTNGVTPRRWMVLSNPRMTYLIRHNIGDKWINNLETSISSLEPFAEDAAFRADWQQAKRDNKVDLAEIIQRRAGVVVDPDSLFDIQVKRLHEYKRQHLNVLNIVTLYNQIKNDPNIDITPRTFIFGGKAAPGYFMAKLIIKLINSVADVVNKDPDVKDRLKVVFLPDFNVKHAQRIYPAADLSEQISTAGKEASGTGNMKFSLSGALTIGTLDGANVEMRDEVGSENFFLFGLTAEEVVNVKASGYAPREIYHSNEQLRQALDLIGSGLFSHGDTSLFSPLLDSLINYDEYMLLADYQSYIDCQSHVSDVYRRQDDWARMSILNVARMGKFSSDRSMREYCEDIWKVKPVTVDLNNNANIPT